jgi:serine O-acetyltransferase
MLYFKGFHGVTLYRVANHLLKTGQHLLAFSLQSKISEVFAMDLHPRSSIGKGVMFDHAQGIVVGETAVIGDGCNIFHNVVLAASGSKGERHPKLGRNVMVGAGSVIVGNIHIGDNTKIAAGSVVVESLPNDVTVAGVPA